MNDPWTERWNERYRSEAYAYGETPNLFLAAQLELLTPGSILFPAEGEGRNAVHAAKKGWNVSAFDISDAGRIKAMKLAAAHQVSINYQVGELHTLNYSESQFDALALIYAHFPAAIKSGMHRSLDKLVRKGGVIIFEAFSKNHIAYNSVNEAVGGPKDIDQLFSIDEIKADFTGYDILELEEKEIELNEGLYHIGRGSVIRFVGKKQF